MTSRALLHPAGGTRHDMTTALRDSLRTRAIAGELLVNGAKFFVVVEPLIKKGSDGEMLQTVRVRGAENQVVKDILGEVTITSATGDVISRESESGPNNSTRIFIPEVEKDQEVSVSFSKVPGEKVSLTVKPQRHWTIHLVHHTHLDIGYTDPQGVVLAEHLAFLDACLDLTKRTDDWPDDSKFRWCVEALWSFDEWAKVRPKEKIDEFVARVKEGRIELTAMPYNLHSETCSTDELHELLRLAREVKEKYALEIPSAMQTDVPGAVVGLTDVMAENGVKYLSVAHNWAGRSVPHLVGGQDQPRLFRWVGPSGKGVLVWVTDTPHGLAYMEGPMLGFNESYDLVDDLLPSYLQSHADHPYPYPGGVFGWAVDSAPIHRKPYPWDILHLRIQGQFADNAPPRFLHAETVKRWNEKWEYPRLRLSTNQDFFEDAESRIGSEIQTIEGDWTDWWVEGVGSGARPMSMVRNAQANVSDSQTIGALGAVFGSIESEAITKDAQLVYANASLFDEHTWGAANPWTIGDEGMNSGDQQWHWKYSKAIAADDDALVLLDRAMSHLGDRLGTAPGAIASYYLTNTCSWARTGEAVAFLTESRVPLETTVKVIDSRTGKELPFYERKQVNPKHRNAGRYLHILIDDIPSVGLVRVDIVKSDKARAAATPLADPTTLENDFLKVKIDFSKATISSIYSKETKSELVRQASVAGFNAYIYDEYASAGGFNHQSGRMEGNPRLDLLATRSLVRPAIILDHGRDEVRSWVTYESSAPGSQWVRTTLSLIHGVNRLDIHNRLYKAETMTKESGYFAFPFAFENPTSRIELSGGMTGSDLPLVPGSALHMRAVRRWVSFEEGGVGAALVIQDAPLIQMGGVALPYAPFPQTMGDPEPATVYSWIHNNIWDTNFPAKQGFEMNFRYSVTGGKTSKTYGGPTLGLRASAANSRSLRATLGTGEVSTDLKEFSLLSLSDERVRIVGLTTPEHGKLLVRLQSFAEEAISVKVKVDSRYKSATEATYLGDHRKNLEVKGGEVEISIPRIGTTALILNS
jgi:hypothetical protein